MNPTDDQYSLHNDNLIPFYLVEDKIKHNFSTLNRFVIHQKIINSTTLEQITQINSNSTALKEDIAKRFADMETKILKDIGRELEGRIIVAVNKSMSSFAGRMEDKERQIAEVNEGITTKLEAMKKTIIYQVGKDNQKSLLKEIEKTEKKMNTALDQLKRHQNSFNTSQKSTTKVTEKEDNGNHQSSLNQESVFRIKEAETKIAKVEDFLVGFDKRFYESMSSLKESWKELGADVLETKKRLTMKQDQQRLELIKLKTVRQFEGGPEEVDGTFKARIMGKFTDIYQLLGQLATRTDLESEIERIKKTLGRVDEQARNVREELSKNSDYFTFYINNSNTDDLHSQFKIIREQLQEKQRVEVDQFRRQSERNQQFQEGLSSLEDSLTRNYVKNSKIENDIGKMREDLLKEIERIDALEDQNNISPSKMAKIHNTLDIDFSPNEQELIAKKTGTITQNALFKELKAEISKMKDEVFVMSHQLSQMEKIKKLVSGLEGRLDKIKIESEEAILTRKPWVCLSCDKNDKKQHDTEKVRREGSKNKLLSKDALFSKDKSERIIKLIPTGQQKYEVYERYREKYMSDSIKLPDIYKEKIGQKQPSLI